MLISQACYTLILVLLFKTTFYSLKSLKFQLIKTKFFFFRKLSTHNPSKPLEKENSLRGRQRTFLNSQDKLKGKTNYSEFGFETKDNIERDLFLFEMIKPLVVRSDFKHHA
ncbi:CLUMA_CG018546, isoform A [Clunio marinus]|uniref:CLUMA_CG018546, isoform A n=1 Tax=Clunio marinus TaxID=568069 RepID=A0A1J1J2G6_9DIPT|nr:CLUMA_CG018546, isoform A [Clunio marinus]